jgi:small subunit ribosomal protein S6e
MVFKLNIAEKTGKTFKLELDSEYFIDKELHNKIDGKEISPELEGYEFEIAGTSDKAGFTSLDSVEGVGLKKVLLSYEKGMKNRPKKEGKIKRSKLKPKGLRLRKTVRGKVISPDIVQINLKILKEGGKKLSEIFPDQNKKEVVEETKKEEVKKEE